MIDPIVNDEIREIPGNSGVGSSADARPSESNTLESRQLSGAISQTLFGKLNAVYTLECERIPSEEEICRALRLRVNRDCGKLQDHDYNAELTSWHGGWTCEGIGIFSAEISCTRLDKRTRHLGRACVKVRTCMNSGSRTWNGVAC